jgi:hypothetical protein
MTAPLEQNGALLPSTYKPKRIPNEKEFKLLILLPIVGLGFEDLGKLNHNNGCNFCGNIKTLSKCSGCYAAFYCSKGIHRVL